MPAMTGEFRAWRKSSRSAANGNCVEVGAWRTSSRSGHVDCVEVGHGPAVVGIRDSQDPDGAVLTFRGEAWSRFTAGLKRAPQS